MALVNRWTLLFGGLAIVLAGSGTAQAQFPGRGGGMFGGRQDGITLLRNEAVQKELGLSDEAKAKAEKLLEEVTAETRAEMEKITGGGGGQAFQNLSQEERQELQRKMAEMSRKIQDKVQPQLKEVLNAEQQARLKQIGYQVAGATALTDANVAKELGISADQTKQITSAIEEAGSKQRELFPGGGGGGGGDIQERMTKVREINTARDEKVLGTLSTEQKAAFEKLKGKPFDVAQLRGQGGPGGGRPGGKPGATGRPGGGGGKPGADGTRTGGKPGGGGRNGGRAGRPEVEGKPVEAPKP